MTKQHQSLQLLPYPLLLVAPIEVQEIDCLFLIPSALLVERLSFSASFILNRFGHFGYAITRQVNLWNAFL